MTINELIKKLESYGNKDDEICAIINSEDVLEVMDFTYDRYPREVISFMENNGYYKIKEKD